MSWESPIKVKAVLLSTITWRRMEGVELNIHALLDLELDGGV
jgi:hypothetical protein